MTELTEESLLPHVPSRRKTVLDQMLGQTIKDITRYMDPSFISFAERHYPSLKSNQFFSMSYGTIKLSFENGLIVGFSYTEYLSSILLNLIQDENQTLVLNEEAIQLRSKEIFIPKNSIPVIINITDSKYSQKKFLQFLGKKVSSIGVIKQHPEDGIPSWNPTEQGIVFHFENGEDLIFSYSLGYIHAEPSILTRDELNPKRLDEKKEFEYQTLEEWDPCTDEDPIEWDWNYWRIRELYAGIKLNIGTGGNTS